MDTILVKNEGVFRKGSCFFHKNMVYYIKIGDAYRFLFEKG